MSTVSMEALAVLGGVGTKEDLARAGNREGVNRYKKARLQ